MAAIELTDSILPYSLDAEQAVLGSILVDASLVAHVTDKLEADCFHIALHRDIFGVIGKMFVSGEDINIVSLIDNCLRQSVFDTQDEARAYLLKLAETAINPSSIESYAAILTEKYLVRKLMIASKEIYDLAVSGTEEPTQLLDFAEKRIFDIRSDRDVSGLKPIGPIVRDQLRLLAQLAEDPNGAAFTGLHTAFPSVDKLIFGLNPSDLILIAARPGMGKTSFAMNIAVNVAKLYKDKKICVFSLEMSREQIVSRMLSSEGKITSEQMRTGKIEKPQWQSLGDAAQVLNQLEVYVDDTANISIGEMKAKLRRMKNLGVVIIDYLQLMTTNRKDGNRVSEISEITRNLKIMAKELNVPVISLSQLSRGPEQRPDKRPMLSDLRDSGSIEQDADIVLFLYRNGYYDKEDENQNACECIVAKNRHGETGTAPLYWDGQFTRFTDTEYRYENYNH